MPGARLFYSYASADEQLRVELETHLALMKREGVVETWSFRQIDAGSDWKRAIDTNLNTADLILLLISANFIASDYCWDIEMDRAIERHDTGEAIVIPVILKPCDWHTAPFAKLQALPDGAKPVISWRPRDRAWANVVAGIRRTLATRGEFSTQSPDTVKHSRPRVASAGKESAREAARRISQSADFRKERGDRIQKEGHRAFSSEVAEVYSSLLRIVNEIQNDSPTLDICAGARNDRCVIRIGRVTFNMYSYQTNPLTESCLVGRLWFGGILLPEEEGRLYFRSKPKEFMELTFFFDLGKDGEWCWHPKGSAEPLKSVELAEKCVTELLEFHDAVEAGRINFPDLDL